MSIAALQIKFTPKRMLDKKEAALNCASQNSLQIGSRSGGDCLPRQRERDPAGGPQARHRPQDGARHYLHFR
jgi:hypothetical protein